MTAVLADRIRAALPAHADADRALGAKAYLKSDLVFLGLSMPELRRICRAEVKAERELTPTALTAAATALWTGIFEERAAAVEILMFRAKLLAPEDAALVERMIRESRTWALVDSLSTAVMGEMVQRHPALTAVLDRWAADPDFWVRRAAMLSLLVPLRQGKGDFERFTGYADTMLEDKEFFIRKAIGWILRATGRRTPDRVHDWLLPRAARASGLTVREAVRHLPAAQRDRLLAAHKARTAQGR